MSKTLSTGAVFNICVEYRQNASAINIVNEAQSSASVDTRFPNAALQCGDLTGFDFHPKEEDGRELARPSAEGPYLALPRQTRPGLTRPDLARPGII